VTKVLIYFYSVTKILRIPRGNSRKNNNSHKETVSKMINTSRSVHYEALYALPMHAQCPVPHMLADHRQLLQQGQLRGAEQSLSW